MTAGPHTVLVVEDQPLNRELLTDLLEAEGYRVLQAADGERALELAGSERPDLILMDIALPGLNGLDATLLLKRDASTQHIFIAVVSALASESDEQRARAYGCDAFLSKPISTRTFAADIARMVGRLPPAGGRS